MLQRAVMALVGISILLVYTALSFAGFLVLQWFILHPPDPLILVASFGLGIVLAGYIGYRIGIVRMVASLEARELTRLQAPEFHRRLDRLASQMHVSRPPVLLADLGAPNALSIGGPRKGVIVLDQSLLRLLTIDELESILAHELAHMETHDTFLNTLAITAMRTISGVVFLLFLPFVLLLDGVDRSAGWFAGRPGTRFGLAWLFKLSIMLVVGVIFGLFTLLFLAYNRQQEYAADSRAAAVTGNPAALARALMKIHRAQQPRAGIFSLLYIHDERREDTHSLLSTHPPLESRLERLVDRVSDDPTRQYVGQLRTG